MSEPTLDLHYEGNEAASVGDYTDAKAFALLLRPLQPPSSPPPPLSNEELSIEAAAGEISAMASGGDDVTSAVDGLFGSMACQIAEQIPHDHPSQAKLVGLLNRLATFPNMNNLDDTKGELHNYRACKHHLPLNANHVLEHEEPPCDLQTNDGWRKDLLFLELSVPERLRPGTVLRIHQLERLLRPPLRLRLR
jgi:hypothetical protein